MNAILFGAAVFSLLTFIFKWRELGEEAGELKGSGKKADAVGTIGAASIVILVVGTIITGIISLF